MVMYKNMDFRNSLGLIFMCLRYVIRSKKNPFKIIFTTYSPWRSAQTAIKFNLMENGYLKIPLKRHFLKEFWQIWEHFINVICQQKPLNGGLKFSILWQNCHFWHTHFWENCRLNGNSKSSTCSTCSKLDSNNALYSPLPPSKPRPRFRCDSW